jgi:O-antigen/teichoic acid export membrane protein
VPGDDLKEAAIRGLRWLALTKLIGELLGLICAVALARLITPRDFGHAAVALIFLPLAGILTFEGFASALVQQDSVQEDDRRAAMMMSLLGGLTLTVVVFGLTVPFWRPVFGHRTASLIELISPILLIAALGGVSRATLLRDLNFRRVSMIDMFSVVGGNVLAVTLAATGLGAAALVVGALAQTALSTVLLQIAAPSPVPLWAAARQRNLARFGLPASLSGLVEVLFRNVDYAILAARLSPVATGIYYRAFNLGVVYQDKISGVMVQVAYPVYSRTHDKEELRQLHERAARVHAVIIFPLLTLLMVLAPVLIPFVFGDAWRAAIKPTQVLALAGMLAAVLTGYAQVMLAIGRPRPLLYFNIGRLVLYGTAVAVACRSGLMTVAIAVVGAYVVILVGAYRLLLERYVGIRLARLVPELGPAAASSVALAAVAVPLVHLARGALPVPITVLAVGAGGLAAYGLVLRLAFKGAWRDARMLTVRLFPPVARIGQKVWRRSRAIVDLGRRVAHPVPSHQHSALRDFSSAMAKAAPDSYGVLYLPVKDQAGRQTRWRCWVFSDGRLRPQGEQLVAAGDEEPG